MCCSHFEQYERCGDVVQDVEVFCSTGTVQRSPVCREDELQETSTSCFISPLKTQITFMIYTHFRQDEGSVASLRNTYYELSVWTRWFCWGCLNPERKFKGPKTYFLSSVSCEGWAPSVVLLRFCIKFSSFTAQISSLSSVLSEKQVMSHFYLI